jgi:hypothetical protein
MNVIVLLFLLTIVTGSWYRPSWIPPITDTDCTFTRTDVYNAFLKHVDVNPKDNKITELEINEVLRKYLPMYLKPLIWGANIHQIFESCTLDKGKKGYITPKDFRDTHNACFPTKASWCTVQWFNERIEAGDIGKRDSSHYIAMEMRKLWKKY